MSIELRCEDGDADDKVCTYMKAKWNLNGGHCFSVICMHCSDCVKWKKKKFDMIKCRWAYTWKVLPTNRLSSDSTEYHRQFSHDEVSHIERLNTNHGTMSVRYLWRFYFVSACIHLHEHWTRCWIVIFCQWPPMECILMSSLAHAHRTLIYRCHHIAIQANTECTMQHHCTKELSAHATPQLKTKTQTCQMGNSHRAEI